MDSRLAESILEDAERAFRASGAVSLSLALGVNGEVAAARAWGFADADRGIPATQDTPYLLASVTKPITATAISSLVGQRLLSFESPVSRVLGYRLRQVTPGPEPTVGDLLAHRGGVGQFYRFYYDDTEARPHPDFAVTAGRHAVVTTPPGQRYRYSNLGYGILDHVLETVTSAPAPAFLSSSIFEPLGMSSAVVGPHYPADRGVAAERYGTDGTAYPPYDVDHRGASLAWGTATDIVRFGLAHCASGVYGRAPEMRRQKQPAVAGADVGYAWRLRSVGGELVISHSGGMGGVSSLLLVCPKLDISVVALVNQTYSELARDVAHAAMSRLLSRALGRDAASQPMPDQITEPAVVNPEPPSAGVWNGEIETEHGTSPLRLELRDDGTGALYESSDPVPRALRFLPAEGHDLRVVAPWTPFDSDNHPGAVCLDLVRHENGLCGKIGITDLVGAGLAPFESDGGAPSRRIADFVTYPIELFAR